MNYDNYYKNGGMTKEESVSAIALRIGARKEAVAKFVEKNKIDTNKLNSDLKSGQVYFLDVITAIVGKPNNKYEKEIIKKYGNKMAMGGKTQGYDDREDERLGMDYGKISGKDFDGSHDMREHSRRDDARFEERMAKGGELTYDDFMVGDFYFNSSEGGKFKFVGKDESGRLRFEDSKGIDRIFSPKRMSKYADGGIMARGGYVSKGELVWKKLTNSERMNFLYKNFTPQITPRSQETLVGKDYNFLPKNVKIVIESKYANVEDYADGGETERKAEAIKTTVEIATMAYKNGVRAYDMDFEDFSERIFYISKTSYPIVDLRLAYNALLNSGYKNGGMMADGGSVDGFSVGDRVIYKNGKYPFTIVELVDDENLPYANIKDYDGKIKKAYLNDLTKVKLMVAEEYVNTDLMNRLREGKMADGGEIKVINLSDDDKLNYFINKQDLVEKQDRESDDYTFINDMLTTTYDGKKFYSLGYDTSDKGRVFSLEEAKKNARIITDSQLGQKWDVIIKEVGGAFGEQDFTKKQYVVMTSPLFPREMLREMRDTLKYAKGGTIENQYEGRTAKDIWESWNDEQKIHFFTDHKQHPYYNMGDKKFVVSKNDREKYVYMSYEELPKMVKLMISDHVEEGEYKKGGVLKEGDYVWNAVGNKLVVNKVSDDEYFLSAFGQIGDSPFSKEKVEMYLKNGQWSRKPKMANGGTLPEQNQLNKKVLALIQKANIESKLEFGQLVVSAFTDANAHSKVRKFISIIEKKPEWAEKPKEIDMKLPREEFQKQRAKTVYGSKYYDANEKIDDLGVEIANMSGWGFESILDSLIFASKMSGRNDVAQVLEKLNADDDKQDTTKNKWEYTDKDEIEYVVVKDKSGKELKFDGKYVISGVHDLLEKGGKLTEIGKYYSKNDVVSVFVNGKNILDKNTVSGVWIQKDAKPMAEDVAEMKIGKTTIRKGVNGWVAKTMVDNFKGFDWDITTIKNSRGDLTTTAQGGKSEDKGGYKMFTFTVFQDPAIRLKSSRPARVNEKVVSEQHTEAMKDWKERQDEISEMVDQIQAKKKMADGGAIGFDALAKKVAKNYEGDKVKKQYQDEYGKTYDKKEAEEVGKKVAGKVYGQQQAKKKMAKGGKVAKKSGSNFNRSESKMTLISRKASEIRKANEPWRDAFNRAKAIIG